MEENKPLLIVQPKFNFIRVFLNKYLGTLLAIIFLMVMTIKANLTIYFLIAIAFYLIYIVIKCFITNKQYKYIQYLFYDDKLIILNRTRRGQDTVIYYDEMIDILMTQNYIQRFFNEGELVIKLEPGKVLAKSITLIGIGDYKETTQFIHDIVYANIEE